MIDISICKCISYWLHSEVGSSGNTTLLPLLRYRLWYSRYFSRVFYSTPYSTPKLSILLQIFWNIWNISTLLYSKYSTPEYLEYSSTLLYSKYSTPEYLEYSEYFYFLIALRLAERNETSPPHTHNQTTASGGQTFVWRKGNDSYSSWAFFPVVILLELSRHLWPNCFDRQSPFSQRLLHECCDILFKL